MRRLALLICILALALPAATFAQSKPDFSGSWTLDQAKSDPPPQRGGGGGGGGGGRMGGGGPVTIKMTANELSITSEGRGGPQTLTYKLDGTESTNEMQGRGGPMQVKSKAKWDGSKIVIETTRDTQNGPVTTTETRSLSADGKEMTVETKFGENSRKTVYTKG
jgi:hypothetical protein